MEHKAEQHIIKFEAHEIEALPGLPRICHDSHTDQIMEKITDEIDLCFDVLFRRTPSPLFNDRNSAQDVIAKGKVLDGMYKQLEEITVIKGIAELNARLDSPSEQD